MSAMQVDKEQGRSDGLTIRATRERDGRPAAAPIPGAVIPFAAENGTFSRRAHTSPKRKRGAMLRIPRSRFGLVCNPAACSIAPGYYARSSARGAAAHNTPKPPKPPRPANTGQKAAKSGQKRPNPPENGRAARPAKRSKKPKTGKKRPRSQKNGQKRPNPAMPKNHRNGVGWHRGGYNPPCGCLPGLHPSRLRLK